MKYNENLWISIEITSWSGFGTWGSAAKATGKSLQAASKLKSLHKISRYHIKKCNKVLTSRISWTFAATDIQYCAQKISFIRMSILPCSARFLEIAAIFIYWCSQVITQVTSLWTVITYSIQYLIVFWYLKTSMVGPWFWISQIILIFSSQ